MFQENDNGSLKPRLKTVGRGHSNRPNTLGHQESSSSLRRPGLGSNNGDMSSSIDYNYHDGGYEGPRSANDQENWKLKGELEITRRLLLLKNSGPDLSQSNLSSHSLSPELSQQIFYDEEEDLDSVSTKDLKISPLKSDCSLPSGPAGDGVSRQELDQLHSKPDKVLEMVAANNGSHRSVVSASTSFYDNLERQMSTPPPSLDSIPPSKSDNRDYADFNQDNSVYANYKSYNGGPSVNQPQARSGYELPHAGSASLHNDYNLDNCGTSSKQKGGSKFDERALYGNNYYQAYSEYQDPSNVFFTRTNRYSNWSGNDHPQDQTRNVPASYQNKFNGDGFTNSSDFLEGNGRVDEEFEYKANSGDASSRFNDQMSVNDKEETDDADLEFRNEQEMILRQIHADRERKQKEEALSLKYIQELELPDLTADRERKMKEESLSLKYIQERPDLSKPPPVVAHLRDQKCSLERSDCDYPPLALARNGEQSNDWSRVTKPKRIPASQKLASAKIADDIEKKRKDDIAIKEWRQEMTEREQKEKERIVQNVEEGNKVKFVKDVNTVIKESRPLNNRAQSLSAAPLGEVIPQPRAEKKSLKKRRNQSESQASNAAFEVERRKAAEELKLRLEKQVT